MRNTFLPMSLLAEPANDEKISERTLGYVSELAREEAFDMVASACIEAGIQRSSLAKRLGKDPAQVSRLLSAPGNWTLDTMAEMLFAIDGSLLRTSHYKPLQEPISNRRFPNCLEALVVEPGELVHLVGNEPTAPASSVVTTLRHDVVR